MYVSWIYSDLKRFNLLYLSIKVEDFRESLGNINFQFTVSYKRKLSSLSCNSVWRSGIVSMMESGLWGWKNLQLSEITGEWRGFGRIEIRLCIDLLRWFNNENKQTITCISIFDKTKIRPCLKPHSPSSKQWFCHHWNIPHQSPKEDEARNITSVIPFCCFSTFDRVD